MKLLHAADLHLDSPLRGLDEYAGAPAAAIRGATRRAFERLIDLCEAEAVDVLLLAGDLYDGDWRDYNTGLFLVAQLARARRAGTRVVLIRGNHDAESQITRHLPLPEGVHELSTRRAESLELDDLGLAIHGRGYDRREVSEDLSAGYPPPRAGAFNVGLLHTSATGREGHAPYAPCTVEGLVARGYDYWALGHVHAREVLRAGAPWIVFPGNLQGRHAREVGEKGATLLTVRDGQVAAVEHRPLDVVRWARCVVDVREASSASDAIELGRGALAREAAAAGGRLLAARVVLAGGSRAHAALAGDRERWAQQLRAVACDVEGEGVWVEKVLVQTRSPVERGALAGRDDPLGGLLRALAALRSDPAGLAPLLEELGELRRRLPPEYHELDGALRLDDPAALGELVDQVEALLLSRLLEGGA